MRLFILRRRYWPLAPVVLWGLTCCFVYVFHFVPYRSHSPQFAPPIPEWIDPPVASPNSARIPKWCHALVNRPRERTRNASGLYDCGRSKYSAVCSDGLPRFFSQYNQDIFMWKHHWRHLRRPGTYVDIATNEPVQISNTYFYDTCLRWRGVCIEANSKYYAPIRKHRSCALVRSAVGDTRGHVSFVLSEGFSGILETNKNQLKAKKVVQVRSVKTSDALTPLGVAQIDLLSLDVEGHELFVLKGIDWVYTRINVIVLENTNVNTTAFLIKKGFRKLKVAHKKGMDGELLSDSIFLHEGVKWGKPL